MEGKCYKVKSQLLFNEALPLCSVLPGFLPSFILQPKNGSELQSAQLQGQPHHRAQNILPLLCIQVNTESQLLLVLPCKPISFSSIFCLFLSLAVARLRARRIVALWNQTPEYHRQQSCLQARHSRHPGQRLQQLWEIIGEYKTKLP